MAILALSMLYLAKLLAALATYKLGRVELTACHACRSGLLATLNCWWGLAIASNSLLTPTSISYPPHNYHAVLAAGTTSLGLLAGMLIGNQS